eukprot:3646657-Pleurochrysis_carterae.AAC.3
MTHSLASTGRGHACAGYVRAARARLARTGPATSTIRRRGTRPRDRTASCAAIAGDPQLDSDGKDALADEWLGLLLCLAEPRCAI